MVISHRFVRMPKKRFPSLRDDVFHVVIENFSGNARQVLEGPLAAIKKRFQGAAVNKVKVHRPVKAQHQQQQMLGTPISANDRRST
jgi:hypothetical protein